MRPQAPQSAAGDSRRVVPTNAAARPLARGRRVRALKAEIADLRGDLDSARAWIRALSACLDLEAWRVPDPAPSRSVGGSPRTPATDWRRAGLVAGVILGSWLTLGGLAAAVWALLA